MKIVEFKEIIKYLAERIFYAFNPECPNIYRNLRHFLNGLLGRYSWYNSWYFPIYISERMLPLLKIVRKNTHSYPGHIKSYEKWLEILDDIIFALEYTIYEEYQFNPIKYRKLKEEFKGKYGWYYKKNPNYKYKPARDFITGFFQMNDYIADYDLLKKFEKRTNKGFKYLGKYFTFLTD